MKKIILSSILALELIFSSSSAEAKTVRVRAYYKPSTGAYVLPHYKTLPNKTKLDNFSTKGNYNH